MKYHICPTENWTVVKILRDTKLIGGGSNLSHNFIRAYRFNIQCLIMMISLNKLYYIFFIIRK